MYEEEVGEAITPLSGQERFWSEGWSNDVFDGERGLLGSLLEVAQNCIGMDFGGLAQNYPLAVYRLKPLDNIPGGRDWDI